MEQLITARFLGLPLIGWGGIFTLVLLITTFITGLRKAPLKIHRRLAYVIFISLLSLKEFFDRRFKSGSRAHAN